METEAVEVVVAAARLTLTNALSSFFWCTACAASLASAPRFAPFVELAAVSPLAHKMARHARACVATRA